MKSKRYPEEFKREAVKQVTYVRTHEGLLYVSTVIDLFSRRVVGWSMDKMMDRHLVINALLMAVWQRKPKDEVLVHSDQGTVVSFNVSVGLPPRR